MKVLKEEDNYDILINKYNKNDSNIALRDKGVIFYLDDLSGPSLRLPRRDKSQFIHKAFIAEYEGYLYIPDDMIPSYKDGLMEYDGPNRVDKKLLKKYQWRALRDKYPYRGQ